MLVGSYEPEKTLGPESIRHSFYDNVQGRRDICSFTCCVLLIWSKDSVAGDSIEPVAVTIQLRLPIHAIWSGPV